MQNLCTVLWNSVHFVILLFMTRYARRCEFHSLDIQIYHMRLHKLNRIFSWVVPVAYAATGTDASLTDDPSHEVHFKVIVVTTPET